MKIITLKTTNFSNEIIVPFLTDAKREFEPI
jgi:hypothetical protein